MGTRSRTLSALSALVILAGGASTRMGQDKASLKLDDGRTLLDYTSENLLKLTDLIFVSSSSSFTNKFITIPDIFENKTGPVGGIISSITWLHKYYPSINHVYFVPVDAPCLTASILMQLSITKSQLSYFNGYPLPLMIKINDNIIQKCDNIIEKIRYLGGYSVKALIQDFGNYDIFATPSKDYFTNLNYFEDWKKFKHENSI